MKMSNTKRLERLSERHRQRRYQPPNVPDADGRGRRQRPAFRCRGWDARSPPPPKCASTAGAASCRRRSTSSPSSPTPRNPASRSCRGRSATRTRSSPRSRPRSRATSRSSTRPASTTTSNTSNGGYNSEINEANIPNMANVLTAMIEPFRKITPKLSAVPYDYGTTGIAYNTKVISPEEAKEKGANLLADKKYAGKIGGYADMTTRVWYAALQTGQDPNNITGHGCGLGQGPRDPRPRQEVLELGRRTDGPPVEGRDRGDRRLVGPRCGPAAAGCSRSAISILPAPMPGWRTCWCSRARRWPNARN